MTRILTPQQRTVVASSYPCQKVAAFAGTGKTTTLQAWAEAHANQGILYLAFNKAVQQEAAAKFPSHVTAKTAHALAYQSLDVGRRFGEKLGRRLPFKEYQALLDIPLAGIMDKPAFQVGHCIRQTITRFQASADDALMPRHIPPAYIALYTDAQRRAFNAEIVSRAEQCWQWMCDATHRLGMDHDTYLKLWQLQKPRTQRFQAILFDECQDANPVMLDIVSAQRHTTTVYVGDRHQQIYAWRGAVNAMDAIDAVEHPLTQSFRFGPCIATVANRVLSHQSEPRKMVGYSAVHSELAPVTLPFTVLCRTNGGVFANALQAMQQKRRLAVLGGIEPLLVVIESAYALFCEDRFNVKSPNLQIFSSWEEMCSIGACTNDPELLYYEKMVADYGHRIPKQCAALREKAVAPAQAEVLLSTVHKAKGQEWSQVKLANDFNLYDRETGELRQDEINVVYVACTRAMHCLDVNDSPHILRVIKEGSA